MEKFFNPQGIAIFGASPSPKNLARIIIQNLTANHYRGTVVGIGSRDDTIQGVPIYKTIREIKEFIDLAVIITPAPTVIPILKECHQSGITRAVIMTAGFKEYQGANDHLSTELMKACHDMGIRFIGPNCQGVINTRVGLCLPFAVMPPEKLKPGDISLISQSGSISWMGPLYLSHELSGVNKVISIGNKMDINEVDALRYLMKDETTKRIILYLESTERGRELFTLLSQSPKPVIFFKAQVCQESTFVAYSHTAALADDDRVVEGAAVQAGVLRATTFREIIEMAKALSLEPMRGNRLGIISASGGVGIMAADTCKRMGMPLATLPDTCLNEIKQLPKAKVINIANPIDTGNIYDYEANVEALKAIINVEDVDGLVWSQFHPQTGDYFEGYPSEKIVVQKAADLSREKGKPIAIHFLCDPLTREGIKAQTAYPIFDAMEEAVSALYYLWQFNLLRQRAERWKEPLGSKSRAPFRFDHQVSPDLQGFRLLSQYKIPCEHPLPFSQEKELFTQAETVGYPLALKALSPDFTHKLSQGAVFLNVMNKNELKKAFRKMITTLKKKRSRVDTLLLQKMTPPGPELIFGGKRDPHYGPVILLGRGGTDAEARGKAICFIAPISRGMAEDMLASINGPSLINRAGHKTVTEALTRFSQLLVDNPRIQEIDLNPVRLLPDKETIRVLDVRIKLSSNGLTKGENK
jgi:acetate---CoA ligase (ADP-forming)